MIIWRRRGWRLLSAVLLGLLALVLVVTCFIHFPRPATSPAATTSPSPAFLTEAIPIEASIHINNLYNLQLDSQSFSADGWYWLHWDQRLEDLIRSKGLDRNRLVGFANQVEGWDALIQPATLEPIGLPDGTYSQMVHFSARFYIFSFDLHDSPFDTISLPLVLETRPEILGLTDQSVRLKPAAHLPRLVGDYGELAGYELRGASLSSGIKVDDSPGTPKQRLISQLLVKVTYGTNVLAAFHKWILPLLIVMTVVLLAPSLEASLGDIRLAIPSTALLTLVFLQQAYRSELPPTPYPTFLDHLYAYSYLITVGVFLLFVWSSNRLEATPESERKAVRLLINRIDTRCQTGALMGFVVWALLAWLL